VVPAYSAGYHWFVSPPRKPKKCSKPFPTGQWVYGPDGPISQVGISWALPNCAVAYPFSFRISATVALLLGRTEV
jgi:hypothetical protein